METPNFEGVHLWDRLNWAKANLRKVQPTMCIAWEDPQDPDAPMKVTTPDPNFMAAALQGGILPPIEAYLADQEILRRYEEENGSMDGFNWHEHGPANHPYVAPMGPMKDEDEVINYIIQKDIPRHVWAENYNSPKFFVVNRKDIPKDRTNRNAWRLNNFHTEMEAA